MDPLIKSAALTAAAKLIGTTRQAHFSDVIAEVETLAGRQLSREEETAIRQLLAPEALTGSCTGLPAGFVIQKPSVFRTRQRD